MDKLCLVQICYTSGSFFHQGYLVRIAQLVGFDILDDVAFGIVLKDQSGHEAKGFIDPVKNAYIRMNQSSPSLAGVVHSLRNVLNSSNSAFLAEAPRRSLTATYEGGGGGVMSRTRIAL